MSLQETLGNQYILGRLSTRMPTLGVRLKEETRDLEIARNAASGTLGVSVRNIFNGSDLLLRPTQILRAVRSHVNERTVPWSAKTEKAKRAAGPRLIHVNQAAPLDRYVSDARQAFEDALFSVTEQIYEDQLAAVRLSFGNTASQITWPDWHQWQEKHDLSFELEPFPAFSPKMMKAGLLPAEFVSKFATDYEQRERKLVEFAFEERKTRLIEALENLHKVLGTEAKLFASTLKKPGVLTEGGIGSLARALGKDTRKMEDDIEKVRSVTDVDIGLLRANYTMRMALAHEIADLLDDVKLW